MKKLNFLFVLCALVLFTQSCKNEEENTTYEIPTTYNFDNVSYSGQTDRLGMLGELKSYINTVTDGTSTLSAAELAAKYSNTNATWTNTYGSKQLRNKTDQNVVSIFDNVLTMAANDASSPLGVASNGTAGIVTSVDGQKKYFVNANGVEYAQIMEKGLMGACLMYQATTVYLGSGKMDADNVTVVPGEGTDMEHHWDESFGYFGVPTDFPANTNGLLFWGKYTNDRNSVLTGINSNIMNGYITGRAAISNNDLTVRDQQIEVVRDEYDRAAAATGIHYINSAITNANDPAKRLHALSEAVCFIYAINFNPNATASSTQVNTALTTIGGSSSFMSMNFYNTTDTDLQTAKDQLASIYGWDNIKDQF